MLFKNFSEVCGEVNHTLPSKTFFFIDDFQLNILNMILKEFTNSETWMDSLIVKFSIINLLSLKFAIFQNWILVNLLKQQKE